MNAKLTAIFAPLALSFATCAYAQTSPATSGSSGQPSQKQAIDQQHKAAAEKCSGMKDTAKDICKAEADGQKTVAEAQAKVTERDTPKNRLDLDKAKAEAQYKVAKAQCGDQVGDAKKACEKEAKAVQDLAIARAERQSLTQSTSSGSSSGSSGSSGTSAPPASPAGQPTVPGAGTAGNPSAGQPAPPASEPPKAQ